MDVARKELAAKLPITTSANLTDVHAPSWLLGPLGISQTWST
jgi:hypothetical protein